MNDLLKMPKTPKGVETLNKILSAAVQLIYEKGYHGANIGDITKLAGVATGTFYVYFNSKISLYRYLILQFGHSIRHELAEKTRNCKTRRETERVGLRAWLEYVVKHPYVYNIIWESLYVDKKLFSEYYETFESSYVEGLKLARDNGELADIDLTVLTYALMGISNFVGLKYCMFSDAPVDLDAVTDEAMKLVEKGIFTDHIPTKSVYSGETARSMNFRVEVDMDFFNKEEKTNTEG